MAEGVNVRISGKLLKFVKEQTGSKGMYESVSEYVRALIRADYEREEARKWQWLINELKPGMEADESEFVEVSAEDVIAAAKKEKRERSKRKA